jgi:hypothetical protein
MKQIELNLGGEKRTFYFGLGFLGNLLEKENVSINEIDAFNYVLFGSLWLYSQE